jgi:hypothetical protein
VGVVLFFVGLFKQNRVWVGGIATRGAGAGAGGRGTRRK